MTEFSVHSSASTAGNAWFEKVTRLVNAEFQVEESFLSQGVPTYVFGLSRQNSPFCGCLKTSKNSTWLLPSRKPMEQ
jgi:hypothetical protein